jgi:hypothetical protein
MDAQVQASDVPLAPPGPPRPPAPAQAATAPTTPDFAPVPAAADRPAARGVATASRVVIDHVQVTTQGVDAIVEVRLGADGRTKYGVASGPALDGYVLRLCAVAAGAAIDQLLDPSDDGPLGRCYIEQASVVTLGSADVAVVILLLVSQGWVEQLTGSAMVDGDPRQAVVRATLAAVNRRIEALLA